MDDQRQFETMALIRAYAEKIAKSDPGDIRPSTACLVYNKCVARMNELQRQLECTS